MNAASIEVLYPKVKFCGLCNREKAHDPNNNMHAIKYLRSSYFDFYQNKSFSLLYSCTIFKTMDLKLIYVFK
jgi:hypothetical protein